MCTMVSATCVVSVLIFSGVTDPQWRLNERDTLVVEQMINSFSETALPFILPPPLGYRGFKLECNHKIYTVYKGIINIDNSNKKILDSNKSLEQFLIKSLNSKELPDSLQEIIFSEITTQ